MEQLKKSFKKEAAFKIHNQIAAKTPWNINNMDGILLLPRSDIVAA